MRGNMVTLLTETILQFLSDQPMAFAELKGSDRYPQVGGLVTFYDFQGGTIVMADVCGLPWEENKCVGGFFGFHIHEGGACNGNAEDPFADAGGHYNPDGCPHPEHAGDMPVLIGYHGKAWMAFYTERFTPEEVKGKTVIIHRMSDDYSSQPAGDAGKKIACGMIR